MVENNTRTVNEFDRCVAEATGGPLRAEKVSIVQVNVGLVCNQQCVHCHVAASPRRTERMKRETMDQVLDVALRVDCSLLDITGGAPELHPDFRWFVQSASAARLPVQVRTNLTILSEPGYEDIPGLLKRLGVGLVASLPCYLEENVNRQRGEGVYSKSVQAIRLLNGLGYGIDPGLRLDLVYNPAGPQLPPGQAALETDYRAELRERHGIEFSKLITITNMPIGRFLSELKRQKMAESYVRLLREAFNPANIDGLMCRHQINIDWDGYMYDCDFNLALKMKIDHGMPTHVRDFDPAIHNRQIETGRHCFGCTAGRGSSCGGVLS